jgi:hypothetical protein
VQMQEGGQWDVAFLFYRHGELEWLSRPWLFTMPNLSNVLPSPDHYG